MGAPFRPDGSKARSAVLGVLARLWDQAAHHRAAIDGEKLTQKWLARTSGVPLSTINSWATGASLPRDLDQLTAVGTVLATTAGEPPLASVEWSRLLNADQLNGTSHTADEDDPVIATIDRQHITKPRWTELVVDADPPRSVWRSGTMLVITLEARTTRAVVLHGMRPVVFSREPPRPACFGLRGTYLYGVLPPRMFTLDLDSDPTLLQAEAADFPFTISATDVEQFRVTISASEAEVSFHLEIDWTCAGRRGTTVIDNNGKPFEIYPAANGTRISTGAAAEDTSADAPPNASRQPQAAAESGGSTDRRSRVLSFPTPAAPTCTSTRPRSSPDM